MNWTPSFIRKVAYIVAMIPLLLMISWLGMPAAVDNEGNKISDGGKLAQLRTANNLSQASLGQIDMTSETMKLATLGMRGVAVTILWFKANHYKKVEDWDNQGATLNQLSKLQPNFLKVWDFQAHNLAYNTSVEFDDFEYRYRWVVKGIEFLMRGTRYNSHDPKIYSQVGFYIGQKIGRSDEHKQFRRLFREDVDFHDALSAYIEIEEAKSPNGYDNWLAARQWFLKAKGLFENEGASLRGKTPLLFNSQPAMAQINFSDAIEQDFRPDEVAQLAWEDSITAWNDFGNYPNRSSWGHTIVLNDLDTEQAKVLSLKKDLEKIAPGINEAFFEDETKKDMTSKDMIAIFAPEESRDEANQILIQLKNALEMIYRIDRYRQTTNFNYWKMRCDAEASDEAIAARQYTFDAITKERLGEFERKILPNNQGQSDGAKELYEKAWDQWAVVFKKYPELIGSTEAGTIVRTVHRYHYMLQKIDEPFPDNFPLASLLKSYAFRRPNESRWMPEKYRPQPGSLPGSPDAIKDYLKDALEPQDGKPDEKPQDKKSGDSKA